MNGAGRQPRYYIRDAAQADLEDALAMKAAAWREAYGHLRDESFFAAAEATLPQQVEHWRRELARGTTLWLAEDAQGRCVGLASAGPARKVTAPGSGVAPGHHTEVDARAETDSQPEPGPRADPDPRADPGAAAEADAPAPGPAGPDAGPAGPSLPMLELHTLYVLAEVYAAGVADALLARAIGESSCRLWVLTADERARAFYRRHGFVDVGAPEPMSAPWFGLDAQLMVRRGP